jgi:TRAP-type C4-dicarboxylate transport system substrate-binding protein
MKMTEVGLRAVRALALVALSCAVALGVAQGAEEKISVMKISIPTINDALHQYAKNLAARVEKDSGGRIKAEVYPASQLGSIPRQIEGVQFGSIQCAIEPPEFFVGIDERFEILSAPGLFDSLANAQRFSLDPAVRKLMFGLGANKGLHGAGLFAALPSAIISKTPIRHLADLKGKKIRIFASEFQSNSFSRLGATPVAMSLGDVLPAIQQGAIDGSIAGITVYTSMHYQDAAKFVTETGQPYIFLITELSKRWLASLPQDLQQIVEKAAVEEATAINPVAVKYYEDARKQWTERGGELISLPADEQATMMKTLENVAEEISKHKPDLNAAYTLVADVAKKTR